MNARRASGHRSSPATGGLPTSPSARHAGVCWRALGAWMLAAAVGCANQPTLREYDARVRFESDPERPVEGAELLLGGDIAGASDEDGVVDVRASGREGQRIAYQIRCPPGHRGPKQPLTITLATLSAEAPPPEYRIRCTPEVRSVVIAVRAQHGSRLPVTSWGRELARTDASGAAHVRLQLAHDEPIELTLDTSSRPDLTPQNPSQRFDAPNRDAVLLFDQEFVVLPPPARPPPHVPVAF